MPAADIDFRIANAHEFVGRELAVSDWITIDQDRVDKFGEATEHTHWLHCDPARAAAEGPYGGTLAHGFLLVGLISRFIGMTGTRPADSAFSLNYGLDKVRILTPVVVGDGARVRCRITLLDVIDKDRGRRLFKTGHRIEVEGQERPAAYAEYLGLWVPA